MGTLYTVKTQIEYASCSILSGSALFVKNHILRDAAMYKMKHSVLTLTYVMETFIALQWVKHRYKGSLFTFNMDNDARKHVFGVCEQQRRRPACDLRSLVSAFGIRISKNIIIIMIAKSKISIF